MRKAAKILKTVKDSELVSAQKMGTPKNVLMPYIVLPRAHDFLGFFLIYGKDDEDTTNPFCFSVPCVYGLFFEWRPLPLNWIP